MSRLIEQARRLKPPAWTVVPRAGVPVIVSLAIASVIYLMFGPAIGGFGSKLTLIAGINIILAVSLTVVNGFTGQFSMGHAGFMAVGGYVAASIVYYGSAKMIHADDFADPSVHGGMFSWKETDVASGHIVLDGPAAGFVADDAVKVDIARGYRVRLADDSEKSGPTFPVKPEKAEYQAAEQIAVSGSLPVAWAGAEARLVLVPRVFTGVDALFVGSLLVGGVFAALCGYIVGLPSLRLRGDYLAIVTLGFGEIVRVILQGTPDQIPPWKVGDVASVAWYRLPLLLGGPKGFNLLPTYTTLFWVYLCVCLTLIICYRLKTSSSGRAFLSIREDEIAAQAMGVDITRYKVRAFVLSSFFAGVAGGLYAMDIGAISAGDLGFLKSFDIIIMVVLGGMGSISGAALAAVLLTLLPELLRAPPSVWPWGIVFGAIVAGTAVIFTVRWWMPFVVVGAMLAVWEVVRRLAGVAQINLADYRLIIYALLLISMMILRPQGLFGVHEVWELRPRRRRADA